MTESEWTIPSEVRAIAEKVSERKLRLFGIACSRRLVGLPKAYVPEDLLSFVEEELDDFNRLTEAAIQAISVGAPIGISMLRFPDPVEAAITMSGMVGLRKVSAALTAEQHEMWRQAVHRHGLEGVHLTEAQINAIAPPGYLSAMALASKTENTHHRHLFHDIFGQPLPPVTVNPAWRAWHDGTVVKLAQAIYDERELPSGHLDAGRLAILADALEEAGCSNADILSHCRAPGPHVRGCWVVDLLLGKE